MVRATGRYLWRSPTPPAATAPGTVTNLAAVSDDEPDDDPSGGGAPLPPEDRLWRHPSEVGAARLASATAAPARVVRDRPLWAVAVVAGLTGATVAITALAVTGSLSPRIVERPRAVVAATTSIVARPKTVKALASEASQVVARVEVRTAEGTRHGSAVVVRADGGLLTSARLVDDAERVTVTLGDGRALVARVVGRDPGTGVAVLGVPGLLAVAPTAQARPQPGDTAVTVAGSTEGGGQPSVTSGVVSSVGASVDDGGRRLWGLIELDRPVSDQGDGSALVGADGRITGICLAVPTRGRAGATGYAVPIDLALAVAEDLLAYGKVRRAWLGVEGDDLSAEDARRLNVAGGARLAGVTRASPASRAGLRVDDVVIEVGGTPVRSMGDLVAALQVLRPGEKATFTVVRAGEPLRMPVTLAER